MGFIHEWAQATPTEPRALSQVAGLGPDCESGLLGPLIFPAADRLQPPDCGVGVVGEEDWRG